MRHVNRMLAAPDQLRRVVHDAGRRDQHLRRQADGCRATAGWRERRRPRRTAGPSARRRAAAAAARPRRSRTGNRPGSSSSSSAITRKCYSNEATMPHRCPGLPAEIAEVVSLRQAHSLLPAARQRRHHAADRRGVSGLQRRAAGRSLPHLQRQDAGEDARHDDRPDHRRRADAGGARRLHHRADGARAGRLHHQHRRQSLPRSALRAELHAAPRLAVSRRSRALRTGRHSHLRRAVSRARCCSTPTRSSASS